MAKWLLRASIWALLAGRVWAGADPREVVERGKAATAFLELKDGKTTATAVCIHKSGVFITNHHVVKNLAAKDTLKLVINANQDNPREVLATVVRKQADDDLAVLRVEGEQKEDFVFLPISADLKLYETMTVTSFGFPFGKILATKDQKYPDISVNVGRITALRRREGKLRQIQLDAQLNPGNSGGPVLDESGGIIAIVQSGVFATGVNFAVPASALRNLLEKPDIIFVPPPIADDKKALATEFRIKLVPFLEPLKKPMVDLELSQQGRETRKFAAVAAGQDQFSVQAIPVQPINADAPQRVSGQATYSEGIVKGSFLVQKFKVDDMEYELSDVQTIKPGDSFVFTKFDGREVRGQVSGLNDVPVDLGGQEVRIDLGKAQRVEFRPPEELDPTLHYKFSVRDGATQLCELAGTIAIRGPQRAGVPAGSLAFVPYKDQRQKIELPDAITNAVLGGGGRYLLLHLQKTRKVAVYDVNAGKIVRYLSLGPDNSLIAAGMDKLIVVAPAQSIIERWSLQTFEKETSQTLPGDGIVKSITLGYASRGPLLIHTVTGNSAAPVFVNLRDFKEIKFQKFDSHNATGGNGVHFRASASGDVFGLWCTAHSPQGMETMILIGDTVKHFHVHDSAGHLAPNFDGSAILTGSAGVCTAELSNIVRQRRKGIMPCIPSTHPRFYVAMPAEPGAQVNLGPDPFAGKKPAVHALGQESAIANLPDLELGNTIANYSWTADDFTLDKRVVFVPQANQIVSIPFSNDRLIVQKFDLIETLDEAKIDYLFVKSTPSRTFVKGGTYRYNIEVASRAGAPQYELSSGPEGMQLSSAGLLEWKVPSDFKDETVNVIVTVRNSQDQSAYDSFTLRAE